MWPFNKPKREQLCLIWCEDGKIDEAPLPVEKAYMIDEEALEAYHLLHDLLMPMQGYEREVALVSERDAVPLDVFGVLKPEQKEDLANTSLIADMALSKELEQVNKNLNRNQLASAIKFSVLVFAVVAALIALVTFLPNVKLPF